MLIPRRLKTITSPALGKRICVPVACLPLCPLSPDVKASPYKARQLWRYGISGAISPWEVDQQGPAFSSFHCHRLCQGDLHAEVKHQAPQQSQPSQAGAGFRRRLTQVQS